MVRDVQSLTVLMHNCASSISICVYIGWAECKLTVSSGAVRRRHGIILDLFSPSDISCVRERAWSLKCAVQENGLFPSVPRQGVDSQFAAGWELSFLSYGCSHNAGVCRLQIVTEKLVCHATIGAQKEKSLVMTVNIICEFIAPLIQLSTKQLTYRLEKVSGAVLGRAGCSSRASAWSCFPWRSENVWEAFAPTPSLSSFQLQRPMHLQLKNSESKSSFLWKVNCYGNSASIISEA